MDLAEPDLETLLLFTDQQVRRLHQEQLEYLLLVLGFNQ
jgi:hypothetical protein